MLARSAHVPLVGGVVVIAVAAALAHPTLAHAVARTCGPDAVANTATVLCAAPSGPCTTTTVTVSTRIEVTQGGCEFDPAGRCFARTSMASRSA